MQLKIIGEKSKEVKHLNDKELLELINKYYNNKEMNVTDVFIEFNVVFYGKIKNLFPRAVDADTLCPFCHEPVEVYYPSRSDNVKIFPYKCNKCNHLVKTLWFEKCECEKCILERESQEKVPKKININDKTEIIKFGYPAYRKINSIVDLKFKDIVNVGAIINSMDLDLKIINGENIKELAPTKIMSRSIIEYLYENELVDVNGSSPADAFYHELSASFFDIYKVNYGLRFNPNNWDDLINSFMQRQTLSEDDLWDIYDTFRNIAIQECITILYKEMKEMGFNYVTNEETNNAFQCLLDSKFTIGQLFHIISRVTDYFAKDYLKCNVFNNDICSYINRKLIYLGEQIIKQSIDFAPYKRPDNIVESSISCYFRTKILPENVDFFNVRITLANIFRTFFFNKQ